MAIKGNVCERMQVAYQHPLAGPLLHEVQDVESVGCCALTARFRLTPSVPMQLYRRYGARRVSISHPIPVQQAAQPAADAQDKSALQAGPFLDCNVAGRSPDSDMSASQYSANSGSGRHIRLYPDEPLEPGTPSNESTMATQQLWDALQRGRATAYRVSLPCKISLLAPLVAPLLTCPSP